VTPDGGNELTLSKGLDQGGTMEIATYELPGG